MYDPKDGRVPLRRKSFPQWKFTPVGRPVAE